MKKAVLSFVLFLFIPAPSEATQTDTPAFAKAGKFIKATLISEDALSFCFQDSLSLPESARKKKGSFKIKTVVIDPGHGGHDPGTSGANSKEKHNCLAIGRYLAYNLITNYPDLNVIMTRTTDVFIPLNERAAIATRSHADLFISIHCNFIPNASQVHGVETYVLGMHATQENLEVAKRENESILYEDNYEETYGYDPNSPEAHIMFSMFQNAFIEQSILFAQKVQNNMSSEAGRKDRKVKQAGFLVLRHATMPSVLVEAGYLSNSAEENFIRSKKGQKAIANSLLTAFQDYKAEAEGSERLAQLIKLDSDKDEDDKVSLTLSEMTSPGRNSVKPTPPREVAETANNSAGKKTNTPPSNEVNTPPPPLTNVSTSAPAPPPTTDVGSIAANNNPPKTRSAIVPEQPINAIPVGAIKTGWTNKVEYRVQLAASPSRMDTSKGKWTNVNYFVEEIQENNLFKYQVRYFETQDEANEAKQKLRSMGFNDAFSTAYRNGQRLAPGQVEN